ncbi:hypothetical protein BHM03_00025538 [Ensete ventricosum]|nr:hypothetical protein BHM03_00025538 [Ensete ventricosum]
MINIFDLSAHMNGIKQLAENPHRDADLMAVGNHSEMLKKQVDSNAVQREGKHGKSIRQEIKWNTHEDAYSRGDVQGIRILAEATWCCCQTNGA